MPWSIDRDASVLRVHITMPMEGEWENLLDAAQDAIDAEAPLAVYLPSKVPDATSRDADLLKLLWAALGMHGIPILPPHED